MTPKQIIEEFRNAVGGWKIAEPCALQDVPFFRDIQDWLIRHHITRLEEEIEWLEGEKIPSIKWSPVTGYEEFTNEDESHNRAIKNILTAKQKELDEWRELLDD